MKSWLIDQALPRWATSGFDPAFGGFRERLDFSGGPIVGVPHRLVTQARQIYVYSHAALLGWHPGAGSLAATAIETLRRRYRAPDGRDGYVFSVDADSERISDDRRDAYAHAFLLFALAWWYRVCGDRSIVEEADRILDFFASEFLRGKGGGVVREAPSPWRLQNPHMHYFEAMLAWYEATKQSRFLDQANRVFELFTRHFWQPGSQTLSEYFADDWSPAPGEPGRIFEPGHHFEWSWLLRKFGRLSGHGTAPYIEGLWRSALGGRLTDGRLVDEMMPESVHLRNSTRLWPLTEWAKSAAVEHEEGNEDARGHAMAALACLGAWFCRPELAGGWIDRLDIDGRPLVDFMPATSLYHLFLAIAETSRVFERRPEQAAV